jgi:uncharacterized protein (TIGR03086 family)
MTGGRASAASIGGIALLERAINYTLGSLHVVTPGDLSQPTPCPDWDLRALLDHLDDSLLALHQAGDVGRVDAEASGDVGGGADPVARLRNRACRLLGAWTAAPGGTVSVAGHPLTTGIVTSAGAIEVAVHGWDVARACGRHRPIPPSLAEEMLDLARLFVTATDRPVRFAAAVDVPSPAHPGDRLIAFLGRRPHPHPWDGALPSPPPGG